MSYRLVQPNILVLMLCLSCLACAGPTITNQDFVRIDGGCFQMGDQFGDGYADEVPVHRVCLSDFYLSKYEVTQAQWHQIMGDNPSSTRGDDRYPVDVVSWHDVERFIQKLNARTKGGYRLPTEAEWEFACRAGGKKIKYGTQDGGHADHLVIHSGSKAAGKMMPVGSFPPNQLGLYDMSGNASEWVMDWYDQKYYLKSPVDNPIVRHTRMENLKVRRGGHWADDAWVQRCTYRNWRKPGYRLVGLGFRLAKDP